MTGSRRHRTTGIRLQLWLTGLRRGWRSRRRPSDAPAETRQWVGSHLSDDEAQQLRSLALGSFAHDLRSPVAASRRAVGHLLHERPGAPADDDRRVLEAIGGSLQRLEELLDEVLELERTWSSDGVHTMVELDLVELTRQAIAVSSDPERVRILAVPVSIVGNRLLLKHMLLNLIENGLRYASDAVDVTVGPSAQGALVLIDDDGPGVPPEFREMIFEPFVRLDPDAFGTGLGLALARSIVKSHAGVVWVEDHRPTGSRFGVWLPTGSGASRDHTDQTGQEPAAEPAFTTETRTERPAHRSSRSRRYTSQPT